MSHPTGVQNPTGSAGAPPPGAPSTRAALWRVGAVTFDPRRNSLNLLRLVFAYSVLVAHGWYITGEGVGPHLNGDHRPLVADLTWSG